jgi:hypothetical protein
VAGACPKGLKGSLIDEGAPQLQMKYAVPVAYMLPDAFIIPRKKDQPVIIFGPAS